MAVRIGKAGGVSFPFSSRTIGVLVRSIDAGYTNATIGTLVLEAGADRWEPPSWPNKQTRLQQLFASMRQSSDPDVRRAAIDLVTQVLRDGSRPNSFHGPTTWYDEVRAAVAADGWEYDVDQRRLVPTVPGVDAVEYTDAVDGALTGRGWATAAGHYRQALNAFGRGNWASANAQLRSALEEALPLAASVVAGNRPNEVQAALDMLRAAGQLVDGEYSYAKGLWQLCQSQGSHPGLSDEEESRFRVVSVTAYLRFLLDRLP